MSWHEDVPKVELHVHLEGAIPHAALFELIQKYGGDPSVPDVAALAGRFVYRDFTQFINAWIWKNGFLREYDDFAFIAEAVAHDMARQNIRYAEMFYSPSPFVRLGLSIQKVTEAVRLGLARVAGIEIALIADLVRNFGAEAELAMLDPLNEVKGLGVIGIGIGGSEHDFPPAPFRALYDEARRLGFHTTAHAGEAAGAESVWDAVRILQVERLGHGTRVYEDPKLVRYLAEHRIPLEMCPMSNVRTCVVKNLPDHPIRRYLDAGVIVTINSDDPKMFQTSLCNEYRLLETECGWTKAEIAGTVQNAISASWLPDERKASLAAEFRKAWTPPA